MNRRLSVVLSRMLELTRPIRLRSLLVLLAFSCMTSCDKESILGPIDSALVGTWVLRTVQYDNLTWGRTDEIAVETIAVSVTYAFDAEGSFIASYNIEDEIRVQTGGWETKDGALSLVFADGTRIDGWYELVEDRFRWRLVGSVELLSFTGYNPVIGNVEYSNLVYEFQKQTDTPQE